MMTTIKNEQVDSINYRRVVKLGWATRGNSAVRALGEPFFQVLLNLESLTRILEREWRCNLPRLPFQDLRSVKEFCDGILDPMFSHPWRSSLYGKSHLCLRARSSICASLFLFRKCLPQEKLSKSASRRLILDYVKKMTQPQDPPLPHIYATASSIVSREFPLGWDKRWGGHRDGFTPPVKSCLENRASAGGARAVHSRPGEPHYYENGRLDSRYGHGYRNFTSDEGSFGQLRGETRPMNIWTGGKNRLVTCFSYERSYLSPLHQTIYDHLSTREWILRGDATQEAFSKFESKEGEVFVSGDYKNATDDLNIHLSRYLLIEMSKTSVCIPAHVWLAAIDSLEAVFESGGRQKRGQLMGSLLSFPLLCLSNYVAFKSLVPRDVPVRINGDDIVFRSTREESVTWMNGVCSFGLTLSRGKTLVTKTLFSLNSTFFLGRRGRVEYVPIIRSSCVFVKGEDPASISGRISAAAVGFSKSIKEQVSVCVLRANASHVHASQRSVIRGLRCDVNFRTLKMAGLAAREAFYSSLEQEPILPPPYKRWAHWPVPRGWRSVRVCDAGAVDDPGFQTALVQSCWDPYWSHSDISRDAYYEAVTKGTFKYFKFSRKGYKLLGPNPYLFSDIVCKITPRPRDKGKIVWRKVLGGSLLRTPLRFTSAGYA